MNNPIYLTEEELNELNDMFKKDCEASSASGWDKWRGSDWDWEYEYDDGFFNSKRKKHDWVAILLLSHTVYDCKHCGVHKDKAKSDFCDDEILF